MLTCQGCHEDQESLCPAAQGDSHTLPPGEQFGFRACPPAASRCPHRAGPQGRRLGSGRSHNPPAERLLKQLRFPKAHLPPWGLRKGNGCRECPREDLTARREKGWAGVASLGSSLCPCVPRVPRALSSCLHVPFSCAWLGHGEDLLPAAALLHWAQQGGRTLFPPPGSPHREHTPAGHSAGARGWPRHMCGPSVIALL